MVASTTETSFNKITFNLKNFRAYLFIYRLKLKQFEKLNGSQKSFNLNRLLFSSVFSHAEINGVEKNSK